jgi:flavin-dependent dehydrogenase
MGVLLFYGALAFAAGYFLPIFGSFRLGCTFCVIVWSILRFGARVLSARKRKVLAELMPPNLEERPKAVPAEGNQYDVVIMGGGMVGLIQALLLTKKLPKWAKIAVIEPKNTFNNHKWGESMVEVSTTLLTKHLGLQDYLLQRHSPKHGLFYHWPRDRSCSTASMKDYYSIWSIDEPSTTSYQVDRRQLEKDFTEMAKAARVQFYHGKVKGVDIQDGCGYKPKCIEIRMDDGSTENITGRHVVDATGRAFVLGRSKKNLLKGLENTFGVAQGSVFMRVVGVDKDALFDDGYHPNSGAGSRYYGTNHFFGDGFWCWMIPINPNSYDLSLGIVYHPDKVDPKLLNTQEKMVSFLKQNHEVLARLIESADGINDFQHIAPPLGHASKTYLSHDGWYCIGEAACNWDPFYSIGLAMAAFQTTAVTECIRQDLCQVHPAKLAERIHWWNATVREECLGNGTIMAYNQKNHMGHCSAMSWRIFFENVLYFGITFPTFVGEYHIYHDTEGTFAKCNHDEGKAINAAQLYIFKLLDEMVEPGSEINAGFMHTYSPGELTLFGLDFGMHPPDGNKTTRWLEAGMCEPLRLNIGRIQMWANLQIIAIVIVLGYRVRGLSAWFRKDFWNTLYILVKEVVSLFIISFVHDLETYGVPQNTEWHDAKTHMSKNYKF